MNLTLLSNSAATFFEGKTASAFDIGKASVRVKALFPEQNVQPVTGMYPDVKYLIVPEAGVQITAYEDKVVIDKQTATNQMDTPDDLFIRLVHMVPTLTLLKIKSFGLGFGFSIVANDISERLKTIQGKSGLSDMKLPLNASLKYVMPNIEFTLDGNRYTLNFKVILTPEERVDIDARAYFRGDMPEFEGLVDRYTDAKHLLSRYIVFLQDKDMETMTAL